MGGVTRARPDRSDARSKMLMGIPERTLDVAGTATSVLDAGHGAPLVLLHGGIECGGAMWAPVIRLLADGHRVVAPDVPGLGESAPLPRLDASAFAPWLHGVLAAMDAERPTIVAHSLVAGLAARFAVDHGDSIGRLILCGTPAVGPFRMPWRLRYLAARSAVRPSAANAERFARFALLDLDATRQRDPTWFAAFQTYNLAQARRRHVKRAMRQLFVEQTKRIEDAELDRLAASTTLLWGRHDRMVPLAVARAASVRHDWPLHVIDGAAHAPHIEQPEAFVAAVGAVGAVGRGT